MDRIGELTDMLAEIAEIGLELGDPEGWSSRQTEMNVEKKLMEFIPMGRELPRSSLPAATSERDLRLR